MKTEDALLLLAEKFENDQLPFQAIHCLQALLQHTRLLPDQEVRCKARLGRLYLKHTQGSGKAKNLIVHAKQSCDRLMGSYALKAELCGSLGELWKTHGDLEQAIIAVNQGLAACSQGLDSSEKQECLRWTCHLHLQLVDLLSSNCASDEALSSLEVGLKRAEDAGLLVPKVLLHLVGLQMAMSSAALARSGVDKQKSVVLVNSHLSSVGSILADAQALPDKSNLPPSFISFANLHCSVLHMLHLLASGSIQEISQPPADKNKGSLALVETMENMISQVEGASEAAVGYSWIPLKSIRAIVSLIASEVLINAGSVKQGLVQLTIGDESMDQALVDLVSLPAADPHLNQDDLDAVAIWDSRPLLALALALTSLRAQANLMQGKLEEGRKLVLKAIQLVTKFSVLGSLEPQVHILTGLYCHMTRQYEHAEAHFAASAARYSCDAAEAPCTAARTLQACSILAQQGPECVSRAIDAIGGLPPIEAASNLTSPTGAARQGSVPISAMALGVQERCGLQLICGVIRLKLAEASSSSGSHEVAVEQEKQAKMLLSKALKLAHGQLKHHQIVASAMLAMAPLQMSLLTNRTAAPGSTSSSLSDASGAQQMLTSADHLCKNMGDAMTRAAIKWAQIPVTKAKGEDVAGPEGDAKSMDTALIAELARAVGQPGQVSHEEHASVLLWGLFLEGDEMQQ